MSESSTVINYCPDSIQIRHSNDQTKKRPREDVDRQFFPTDAELCQLAALVYNDDPNPKEVVALKNEWTLLCTGKNVKDGYFGAIFWNEKEEQLVIAHRGTSDFKALIADFDGVVRNMIANQIHSACTFAFSASLEYNFSSLTITGHSLGGWLAQTTSFLFEYLTLKKNSFVQANFVNKHPHTVTFDSPGCEEMLIKLCESYYHRYENRAEDMISKLDITTYFLVPNFVNCTNKHIGRLLKFCSEVDKPEPKGIVIKAYAFKYPHAFKYHSIDNFKKAFEDSGSKLFEVLNWPLKNKPWLVKSIFCSLTDYFRGKKCKDEFNNFFEKGTVDNNFNPDCEGLNEDSIGVEYKIKEFDTNFVHRSFFTDSEFAFLEDWKELRDNQVIPSKIEEFLEEKDAGKFKTFLPDFRILKNGVYCNSSSELKILVNRTKGLLSYRPDVKEVMKNEILNIPRIYEAMYKIASDNEVETLPKYEFNFKDTIGLVEFLNQDESLLVINAKNTKDEAFRVSNILQQLNLKFSLFSYTTFQYLRNQVDVFEVFKSKSEVDKILIIDFEDLNDISFLDKFTFSEEVKKKIICLVPSNENEFGLHNTITKTLDIKFEDLSDESQKTILNKSVLINSKNYTLSEILKTGSLPFEAVKEVNCKPIKIDYATNHFNQIFFNLSLAKVARNVDLQALRDFVSDDRLKQPIFFVTGENFETLDIIPKDRIILGKEDEFNDFCLNNVENTIFKLRVTSDKSVQCTEIFDPDLYRKRKFYTEIKLSNKILDSEKEGIFQMNDSEFKKFESAEYCLLISKSDSTLQNFKIRESKGVVEILNHSSEIVKIENKPLCLVKLDGKKLVLKKHYGELQNIRTYKIPDKRKLITEDDLLAKNENITLIINNPGMGKSTILLKLAKRINNSWIFWIDLIKAYEFVNENSRIDYETVATFLLKSTILSSALEKYLLIYCLQNESIQVNVFFDAYDEIQDVKDKKKEMIQRKIMEIIKFLKNETRAKIWVTSRVYDMKKLETELNIFSIGLKEFDKKEQKEYLEKFGLLRSCLTQQKDEKTQVSNLIKIFNAFLNDKRNSFMGIPLQLRMIGEIFLIEDYEIPDNLNAIDLYHQFVHRRYEIYFKEKKSDFYIREELFNLFSSTFEKIHKNVALKFFFKDFNLEITSHEESELNRIGIVKIKGDDIQFIHQTFAEYFCALKLIDVMYACSDDENFQKSMIGNIFWEPNYKIIRRFINDVIEYDSSFLKFVPKLWEKSFRFWEHTEVDDFHYNSLCILHVFIKERNEKLAVAILNFCEKDLLKKLSTVLYEGYTILHLAAKFGSREVLEIFLNNNNIYETVNFRDTSEKTVLSYAAENANLNDIFLKLVESGADVVGDFALWFKLLKPKNINSCLEVLNIRTEELLKTWIPTLVLSQLIGRKEKNLALKVVEIGIKIDYDIGFKIRHFTKATKFKFFKSSKWDLFLLLYKYSKHLKTIYCKKALSLSPEVQISMKDDSDVMKALIIIVLSKDDIISEFLLKLIDEEIPSQNLFQEGLILLTSRLGWTNVLNKLITKKTNVNATDSDFRTPLHFAAKYNKLKAMELLIENGAHIHVFDGYGKSPLYLGVKRNGMEFFSKLKNLVDFTINGSVSEEDILSELIQQESKIILRTLNSKGFPFTLTSSIDQIATVLDNREDSDWNFKMSLLIFRLIIENQENNDLENDDLENDDLENDDLENDDLENDDLENDDFENDDLENDDFEDDDLENDDLVLTRNGGSVLRLTSSSDLILKLIKFGLDINSTCGDDLPPIVFLKNWDLTDEIIKSYPDESQSFVQSLFCLAIKSRNKDIALKMIQDISNLNFSERYESGDTALLLAAKTNQWEIVSKLLDRGADPKISNENNETLLYYACARNQEDLALKLMNEGCNVNTVNVNPIATDEETPLLASARNYNWNIVTKLIEKGGHAAGDEKLLFKYAAGDSKETFLKAKFFEYDLKSKHPNFVFSVSEKN